MTRKSQLSCACAALAISTIAFPAIAQDGNSEESARTENTILVTAQFREQDIQDTPIAITAVSAEMMQAKNQTDLSQLADSAPSVTLRPQGSSFGPSVIAYIRGIGQYDFSPAFEPGVGIYIDDVYYPSMTGAMFDLLDLERVEILRGPQGTLAGRNSIGGAIKLYSASPDGSGGGFVEASYGSRDLIAVRGSADFALTDNLSGRIAGVYKSQDGYVDVLDFGCANPPGSALNDGTSADLPSGTFPIIEPIVSTADNCVVDTQGNVNYGAVRGVLHWQAPDADIEVTLSADYTRDSRQNAAEVLVAIANNENVNLDIPMDQRFICGDFCNYEVHTSQPGTFIAVPPWNFIFGSDGEPKRAWSGQNRTTYEGYNFTANISIGLTDNISIDSITGYGAYTSEADTDGELSPADRGYVNNFTDHWHWSQELRVNIQPADNISLVLGGYYFDQSTHYPASVFSRTLPLYPLEFFQDDYVDADSIAAFTNLGWEIAPGLNLNAGIRYTEESKIYEYGRFNFDGTINRFLDPVGAACGAGFEGVDTADCDGDGDTTEVLRALTGNSADYKGDNIDWRVALDYRFSPDFLIYGSVATGFKGGGTNPRPFNAFQAVGFGPEELISYEVGFKSDFWNDRVRLNVAAFFGDYTDYQDSVRLCPLIDGAPPSASRTPCAARINVGDAEMKGLEVELRAEPVDDFVIDASMNILDFEFQSLSPDASSTALTDPVRNAPEFEAAIGAQYRIDMGGSGSITPRFDLHHTGEIYVGGKHPTTGALTTLDDRTLLHASLTWRNEDEDLSVALRARNLTNEYFYHTIFDLLAVSGYSKAAVGQPREFSITVRKEF